MNIYTDSPAVIRERKIIIGKLLNSGNHNCAIRSMESDTWTQFQMQVLKADQKNELCPVWGDCELQDLAYMYQVQTSASDASPSLYATERANPFIIRDFSRCILCGRCVKACNEIQMNNAIEFGYQGVETKIIAGEDVPLKDSECVFCGECLQACPVGALVPERSFRHDRFVDTRTVRTTCSYCGVGCQMDLYVQDNKIVKIDGADKDLPPNNGSLCVKGRFGYDFVADENRLTTPLIRKNGELVKASWEEAIDFVAESFTQIKETAGPDRMGVLTSARITNEDNYISQKFTRAVLKTNNIDHCARL
jgi:predicted molibdopterin-dependent oxidoreductase YjgC